ncbi:hypothetical protein M758_5G173200, partial [Ceratodon purpureus]
MLPPLQLRSALSRTLRCQSISRNSKYLQNESAEAPSLQWHRNPKPPAPVRTTGALIDLHAPNSRRVTGAAFVVELAGASCGGARRRGDTSALAPPLSPSLSVSLCLRLSRRELEF